MSISQENSVTQARWNALFWGSLTLVTGFALFGLLGYTPGLRRLASIRPDFIPMAPSTAVSFLILTISCLAGSSRKKLSGMAPVYLTLTLLVSLFGLLDVLGYFSGTELNFEDTLVPEFGELNGVLVGRMSPATGLAFFLAGLAAFFLLRLQNRNQQRSAVDYITGALNLSVFASGFVFSLAYFYQKLLLYELPDTIPMALTTALGFLLLSVGLIAARPAGFPLRLLTEDSTRSYLLRAILPLTLFSVFLGLVARFFPLQTLKVNPALFSAAITILVVLAAGFVTAWISRRVGSQIDRQKDDLEKQVDKRTRELEEKVKKLDSSEKAMLYMVEDLNHLTAELKEEQRKLLLSNKELEAFSYSVSHDLRAPLRHINGYIDLLNDKFSAELPEKAQYYLATVTDAANRMGTLIDELLQFSRTGRQKVRKSKIEMNALVREALERIKQDIEKREISWNVQELPQVSGDDSLLKQVWLNLLDNAVKFTKNTQKAEISIGCKEEENNFVFYVRDNGVGFDMKYAHKLFGVFERLHSQAEFKGTGIGLANVQRIIHKHSGKVWAEAEPGKGATFYFSLSKNKQE
ncbi:MAG: ATP-binding protein [candidate division KSB1 bacterium]|nr:ATP-binding protein [candidate division KSB1 bacterium]